MKLENDPFSNFHKPKSPWYFSEYYDGNIVGVYIIEWEWRGWKKRNDGHTVNTIARESGVNLRQRE